MIHDIQEENISSFYLHDAGKFPNNSLPLLIYRQAWTLPLEDAAELIENHFENNLWGNTWRDGVFDYHHYHSTAHEVLAIFRGHATLIFGGDEGTVQAVTKGDLIFIPAGVAHKQLEASQDFCCVGAYPKGQDFDMNYGKTGERPATDENIKKVPLPEQDALTGTKWPLMNYWRE